MKKISALVLVCSLLGLASCREETSNLANNRKMEDTLFKTFETVGRVTVEVKNHEEVVVILGSRDLYHAPEQRKKDAVNRIAGMTMHIYRKDNWLKKGTVVFVEDEKSIEVDEKTKQVYDMNLTSRMTPQ